MNNVNVIYLIIRYLFLACAFCNSLFANYRFTHISQKEGLPHPTIECIHKCSDGFIWIATHGGLAKFNGYDFTVYRPGVISGNRILTLTEDNNKNIWIGTYANGLNKLNKITGKIVKYDSISNLNSRINKIKMLYDKNIWICSNKGLARYIIEDDSFMFYTHHPGDSTTINSNEVYDIIRFHSGDYYVATESDNLNKLDIAAGDFQDVFYRRSSGLSSDYKKTLVEDYNGRIWIAADLHGLCMFDPATNDSKIFTKGKNSLNTNVLSGYMAIASNGKLWVATDGNGINIVDTETESFTYLVSHENRKNDLSSNHIYPVYFDNLNNIWIGTYDKGINYYDPLRFKFDSHFHKNGDLELLKDKSIISVYEDKKQRLWIGTDGYGLFMYEKNGGISHFQHENNKSNTLTTNVITSINEDFQGNILLGTYSGGLMKLDAETGKIIKHYSPMQGNGINSLNVWTILPDSKKRIWLGLLGSGVDLFDPENDMFKNFGPGSDHPGKIDFPNVMAIMEDSDGDIWFGTEGKGIYILDHETNKILRLHDENDNKITVNGIIKSLYEDRWGNVWIGTEGKGLFKFKKEGRIITNFNIDSGLPSDIVYSIISDSEGNLWLGTSHGLTLFNTQDYSVYNFTEEDGLNGRVFNLNTMIRLEDGRITAGSTSGLDIFNPANIITSQNIPRIAFTELRIMNEKVQPGKSIAGDIVLKKDINYTNEINLKYRHKTFSVEFAALNYTLPDKCKYKYILDGFEDAWRITESAHRIASYSNLDPGGYVLRVRASNNDGKWGNNERIMIINILPPFYRTIWFRLLVLTLIALLIGAFYRYRLSLHTLKYRQNQALQERKIMELEKEKLQSELKKLSFHVINRNRMLIEQKNRLLGLSVRAKESIKKGLEDIIHKINNDLNDEKDWKYIEPQIDKVYNNFVTRLTEKYPDISSSELKIAAYIRMGLSTKEISEFMHKTIRAIENDRYRLRKKLDISANESLKNKLMNI